MMDPVVVYNLIRENPYLLHLFGFPLGILFLYGIWKGIRDKQNSPPVLPQSVPPFPNGGSYFQGPIERIITLLTDIRDGQRDAARELGMVQEDQLRQTAQHNGHMEDIKRILTTSMRHDRRFGDGS